MTKIKVENTPLIKQYFKTKSKHPDAILLFRVGDFYEAYGGDALLIVDILNIALTYKSNGAAGKIEMAGFPHHAVDNFLPKLVRAGKRVAICDQLENPKMTKKLVKRGITELVTPGVSTNENILNNKENNFLAGLYINKDKGGIAFLDISTGEFYTAEGSLSYLDKLISNFDPKELIFERGNKKIIEEKLHFNGAKFEMDDWVYTSESANTRLLKHFKTLNLKGFGINNMSDAIIASGSVLYYMDMTEHHHIEHIKSISRIEEERYVRLDRYTIYSLELCNSINEGGKSLLSVIDKTKSSMGGRLLHRWMLFPLKNSEEIKKRQEVVKYFYKNISLKDSLRDKISHIGDLERIVSKISVGRVSPRELIYLKDSLFAIEEIKNICSTKIIDSKIINNLLKGLDSCDEIKEKIEKEIIENPPISLSRGTVIKNGVNTELDELRRLSTSGKEYLNKILEREIKRTGISKLRIGFNNVFGYYLEVRNANKDLVPQEWIRKQTLVSAERYITQELKDYETKILGAEEKISALEINIYNDLVEELLPKMDIFLQDASIIAKFDCLISFSQLALDNNYNCPDIFDDDILSIKQGRHPVIETQMKEDELYVPNDITLDSNKEQIMIITGPNMAGKSALLRQTALITILAQMGSFVPASSAHIGVVDKIFTRVGSSDNISQGESTFMIEMNEAADIINNMSQKSLILFDELGRGTSTYDGISIAWSIVEYIHENKKAHAKTLFATHYHELNEMTRKYDRIKNYHISVKEANDKVIFLRKLVKGGTEHSFGIHVAKMAGMPFSIVKRANLILKKLEEENRKDGVYSSSNKKEKKSEDVDLQKGMQLSFYQLDDPVLLDLREELLKVDINNLTPIEALNKLSYIKKIIKK